MATTTQTVQLVCAECGTAYPLDQARYRCDCGGLLDVVQPLDALRPRVSRDLVDRRLAGRDRLDASGVWRFRELLGDYTPEEIVSKPEGRGNLYQDARLTAWAGLDRGQLWLKHEGENPTGSFKDRGMTVGMTQARRLGARTVACASSGNTSASLAAYAATAGLTALTFVPEGKVSLGKIAQTIAYGARVIQVRGDFDAAMRLVQEVATKHGVYLLNSINPFRLEGQKTLLCDSLQQLGWQAPDAVALPGGNLG